MAQVPRPAFPRRFLARLVAPGTALIVVIALPATLAASPRPEPVQYTRTDLGTLGGESHAYFVNKHGQVAGISFALPHLKHAVLWDNGAIRDVGTLPGPLDEVAGLNDRGQVIGTRLVDSGEVHAFLWTDGVMTDLGEPLGDYFSRAVAINNRGQVVGWSQGDQGTRAFLWDAGSIIEIGPFPGGSPTYATFINDVGQVAGYGFTALGEIHAFLWQDGRMIDLSSSDGTPCGCASSPGGLNARGQVVVFEFTLTGPPPSPLYPSELFVWESGTRTIVARGGGSSGYAPNAINDRGEVSGLHVVGTYPTGVTYAFFWHGGSLEEWNLGGVSVSVAAMNDDGRVVGEGRVATTELHGFSWGAGTITDLGGVFSAAADINDRGMVAGSSFFGEAGTHAALWTPTGSSTP